MEPIADRRAKGAYGRKPAAPSQDHGSCPLARVGIRVSAIPGAESIASQPPCFDYRAILWV
jgi:hypothetical protein